MLIRKANINELDKIMEIYAHAQAFMEEMGNPTQWGKVYPPGDLVKEGIMAEKMYVCSVDNQIACVFYFAIEEDSTYNVIYDGKWLNDDPYGVVHRVASSHVVKGAARKALEWAYEQCGNLKIDTHRNNVPMQRLLESLGFEYCGIIHCDHSGSERLAYQKTDKVL